MFLNFTEISKVPFKLILDHLNIPYEPTQQGELKGLGFIVNIEKNLYLNPLGDDKGSIINFWSKHHNTDLRSAAGEIKKLFIDQEKSKEEEKEPKKRTDYPFVYHSYLAELGISEELAQEYRLTYCPKGVLRGMIGIEIKDKDGQYVGWLGKSVKNDKWNSEYVKIGDHLWNLHRIDPPEGVIILSSGIFRAMKHIANGNKRVVAMMTPNLTETHITLLSAFKGVIIDHPKPDNIVLRLSEQTFVTRRLFVV